jgi:hypothetical protein
MPPNRPTRQARRPTHIHGSQPPYDPKRSLACGNSDTSHKIKNTMNKMVKITVLLLIISSVPLSCL